MTNNDDYLSTLEIENGWDVCEKKKREREGEKEKYQRKIFWY